MNLFLRYLLLSPFNESMFIPATYFIRFSFILSITVSSNSFISIWSALMLNTLFINVSFRMSLIPSETSFHWFSCHLLSTLFSLSLNFSTKFFHVLAILITLAIKRSRSLNIVNVLDRRDDVCTFLLFFLEMLVLFPSLPMHSISESVSFNKYII